MAKQTRESAIKRVLHEMQAKCQRPIENKRAKALHRRTPKHKKAAVWDSNHGGFFVFDFFLFSI